jgi:hypothetical protein
MPQFLEIKILASYRGLVAGGDVGGHYLLRSVHSCSL